MKRFLLLFAATALCACNLDVSQPSNSPSDPATETFAPSLGIDISKMTKTAHGVYYRDTIPGTGDVVTGTPAVEMDYAGLLKNASLFISAADDIVQLSDPGVPAGLVEGMQGMRVGGERLIVVPSALGYGNTPGIPGVPPNSTLVFDVHVISLP